MHVGTNDVTSWYTPGSGAAGMTAPVCAHEVSLSTVAPDKTVKYGGTSTVFDEDVCIPCNHNNVKLTGTDFLRTGVHLYGARHMVRSPTGSNSRISELRASDMVDCLQETFVALFLVVALYSDYYQHKLEDDGGRLMEAAEFNASLLGDEFGRQREFFTTRFLVDRMATN